MLFWFPFFLLNISLDYDLDYFFPLLKTGAVSHTERMKNSVFLSTGNFTERKKHNYQITEWDAKFVELERTVEMVPEREAQSWEVKRELKLRRTAST